MAIVESTSLFESSVVHCIDNITDNQRLRASLLVHSLNALLASASFGSIVLLSDKVRTPVTSTSTQIRCTDL